MGVLHLWEILQPVAQHCTLNSLEGKTLAVDLSGWVCENANSKNMTHVRKPHIRNLFFRVNCLLRAGVKLVFVTEGAPPDLKGEVLSQRATSRYGPKASSDDRPSFKPSRKRFDGVLRECQKMLESLGIACVQSQGEGEALCAYLNMKGVVDGCISEDGDCFLYGGLVVYRNFTMDSKDPHVEMYRMDDIQTKLNLGRRELVALALLTGCDYAKKGIPGIGRELALKFLNRLREINADPLQRFEEWRTDEKFAILQKSIVHCVKKSSHCDICKHPGTNKKHGKKGCEACETEISCNMTDSMDCVCEWHKMEKLKEEWGSELTVMGKALKMDDFPNREVIKEFLMYKEKLPCAALEWAKPNVKLFQEFMGNQLEWTNGYCQRKFLPLLSMWQLTHATSDEMTLVRIVKERTYKGLPCFDVEWKTKFTGDEVVCLLENRKLIEKCYPSFVTDFFQEKEKKRENAREQSRQTKKKKSSSTTTDTKLNTKIVLGRESKSRKITEYFKNVSSS